MSLEHSLQTKGEKELVRERGENNETEGGQTFYPIRKHETKNLSQKGRLLLEGTPFFCGGAPIKRV